MGTYFNPNYESFTCDKNNKIYIDKTGLLDYLNDVIGTNGKYIAVSHARRFGKSHAAGMIDAYYSRGCDSYTLFQDTEIATKDNFRKHLNQYNVIHLDISSSWDDYKDNFVEYTMLKCKPITRYFGFTEEEVKELCHKYDMDFDAYWKNTSSFESINTFITFSMLSGGKVRFQSVMSYWMQPLTGMLTMQTKRNIPENAAISFRIWRHPYNSVIYSW